MGKIDLEPYAEAIFAAAQRDWANPLDERAFNAACAALFDAGAMAMKSEIIGMLSVDPRVFVINPADLRNAA